ncbi:hypothetical protein [Andreprevotia chitinilytica]|uniref:hypothetical protein n=1 Tax=Andreprevotia chitinilytica TaxID=396808 RepID=UPI001B801F05|nr:hypothetical protein [Andreprevotia chitinilytica]
MSIAINAAGEIGAGVATGVGVGVGTVAAIATGVALVNAKYAGTVANKPKQSAASVVRPNCRDFTELFHSCVLALLAVSKTRRTVNGFHADDVEWFWGRAWIIGRIYESGCSPTNTCERNVSGPAHSPRRE